MTLVTADVFGRPGVRRCPVCGAPDAACGGPTARAGVGEILVTRVGGGAMAELARYVDDKGNIFRTTKAAAERRGLKPWTPPGAAAPAEEKAQAAPPQTTARRSPPADKSA